jgi:thiamine-monophosphate kinase
MKLAERGEFGIIAALRQRCAGAEGLLTGIGDDCAVIAPLSGEQLLVTSDMLVEGVHFRRDWTDPVRLGRKCASVNLSDLAAMGATPRYLFLALALPGDLDTVFLDAFFDGFLAVCSEHGAVLAGGDTCAAPAGMTVSVTALGSVATGKALLRSGAIAGDAIYVSGSLGDSALALQQLLTGRVPDPDLARRHHDPQPRVALGCALARAGLASAMIDVSDGLLADLGHLLAASGVGARIDTDALPLSGPFRQALRETPALGDLPLTGGEDYELLFTAPETAAVALADLGQETGIPVTRIGAIQPAGSGLHLLVKGQQRPLPGTRGYKHFAVAPESCILSDVCAIREDVSRR